MKYPVQYIYMIDSGDRLIGVVLPIISDMCGFFFVLSFASAVLHRLAGSDMRPSFRNTRNSGS